MLKILIAVYHVTLRGNRREPIAKDDSDRVLFLDLLGQINGVYNQTFNRHHGLTGHLFQGRCKAILVDSDSHLLEVCRYVDLNPVRAQVVKRFAVTCAVRLATLRRQLPA